MLVATHGSLSLLCITVTSSSKNTQHNFIPSVVIQLLQTIELYTHIGSV